MARTPQLKAPERRKISKALYPLTKEFHNAIPLKSICDVLEKFDLKLLQEDGTEWAGLLCGRDANATFDIGRIERIDERWTCPVRWDVIKDKLYLSWYKHETGRYEINMYLC